MFIIDDTGEPPGYENVLSCCRERGRRRGATGPKCDARGAGDEGGPTGPMVNPRGAHEDVALLLASEGSGAPEWCARRCSPILTVRPEFDETGWGDFR